MNEKEYYSRMEKIDGKISTDRCSFDEVHNLTIQKNYLNKQYIKYLEHNWNELKEYLKDYKEVLENEKESVEGLDLFEEHTLDTLEEVLDKIKYLEEGGNNDC